MNKYHTDPIVVEAYSYKHKLSPHFTYGELIKSNTATRHGIDNIPTELQVNNLRALCQNVLEPIRVGLDSSVIISSGFRCVTLNAMIGGSETSQHMKGEAADFDVVKFSTTEAFEWIVLESGITFDQIIWEFGQANDDKAGWVHISYTTHRDNRKKITTAKKKNGRTFYENWSANQVKVGKIYD